GRDRDSARAKRMDRHRRELARLEQLGLDELTVIRLGSGAGDTADRVLRLCRLRALEIAANAVNGEGGEDADDSDDDHELDEREATVLITLECSHDETSSRRNPTELLSRRAPSCPCVSVFP